MTTSARAASVPVEHLRDGARRILVSDCTFLFERIAPGKLLMTIAGFDRRLAGFDPLHILEQEWSMFQRPVTWMIDAENARNADHKLFLQWTEWLRQRRGQLDAVHVLAGTRPLELTVSISRHLAGMDALMMVHSSRESFAEVTGARVVGGERLEEPAADVRWEEISAFEHVLTAGTAQFTVRRLSPRTLLTAISGRDTGVAGDDVRLRILNEAPPLHWFVDVRHTQAVSMRVQEDWRQFLMANRTHFRRVDFLARPGLLSHIIELARHRAGLDDRCYVYTDEDRFRKGLGSAI